MENILYMLYGIIAGFFLHMAVVNFMAARRN